MCLILYHGATLGVEQILEKAWRCRLALTRRTKMDSHNYHTFESNVVPHYLERQ